MFIAVLASLMLSYTFFISMPALSCKSHETLFGAPSLAPTCPTCITTASKPEKIETRIPMPNSHHGCMVSDGGISSFHVIEPPCSCATLRLMCV